MAHPTTSSGLRPAGVSVDPASVRPRNRRAGPTQQMIEDTSGSLPTSRGTSPTPSRIASSSRAGASGRSSPSQSVGRGLLESSWAPNWSSVQDFASSLIAGDPGYSSEPSRPNSRSGNSKQPRSIWKGIGAGGSTSRRLPEAWGPKPPPKSVPTPDDIAAGTLRDREAQLKARKKASILESYEGVNGGLDVAGRYKRRNSDEEPSDYPAAPGIDDHLVYLHHVQPTDTYAGVVLRYRCQDHAFRKSNGLWTQNIQMRKHLLIPVDACENKGRPCDPPTQDHKQVDLLAATPTPGEGPSRTGRFPLPQQQQHDGYFSPPRTKPTDSDPSGEEAEPMWTHVRWVKLDSMQTPVEIVRVSRRAMGYFPHRRRSMATISAFSTPRHSLDLSKAATNSSQAIDDSPSRISSRRQSSLGGRPTSLGASSTRGRGNSMSDIDGMPPWMRRPGGVGSMGRAVKAPGPAQDGLNTWVNKTLPGFNIDSLPSMSIMGSESARWGFKRGEDDTGIAENSVEEGRDINSTSRSNNNSGFEQAASSIETWLRGAWAKRPGTPRVGSYNKKGRPVEDLDLIEMADTNSEDGRSSVLGGLGDMPSTGLLEYGSHGSTGRSEGEGYFRGRTNPASFNGGNDKGKKSD